MKNLNSGGTKSGKNRYIVTALNSKGETIPKSKLPKGLKLVKLDMSTRIDKYLGEDYKRDKYEGDFPLIEIVLVIVFALAWYLLK